MTTPQNHTPDPLSLREDPMWAAGQAMLQLLEAKDAAILHLSEKAADAEAEVARLQAENAAMRDVLALGRQVMDGLMAESNNDHSVWEGKSISDRWFELRDEFRARLNTAGAAPAQSEQKAPSP